MTYEQLVKENDELRYQLEEANDTIEAIRTGQVDALIVHNSAGHQLYTLKTADQTYRVFIEKMNEGAVTINREGIILYSNSRFAAMVKMPLEKIIGSSFSAFIDNNFLNSYEVLISNAWTTDSKKEIELTGRQGQLLPCLISCNALELDEGVALSLILTDLTSLKETEKLLKLKNEELATAQRDTARLNDELEDMVKERTSELLVSREHFKHLANNIPQMTWTNLPNGEVNYYNQQWYVYTGLSIEETQRWGWQNVVHPDDLKRTMEIYMHSMESGEIFEAENRYRKGSDGLYRWHLNRAVPLKNEDGDILFWAGTATDIEDQKKEIERKDEFIGIASHELKTPLTSLKGYLQLMSAYRKEEVPAKVAQYIDKAGQALGKLQRLVNDLLDVSKIQAGKLEYALQKIDINELIKSCIESSEHIYPDHEFRFEAAGSLTVTGNAERLEQVIMNLVNNAVKYSPGNETVILKTQLHEKTIRTSVTDFGIGLSADQKELIFERFYRVEDKKYMISGLGMGLYISSEIIKNHQGTIGVSSEPGKGSTFYFDLPLLK